MTPRPYISFSQLALWERNSEEYRRIYFYGGERPETAEMELGAAFHKDMEIGKRSKILRKFPKYPKCEYKMGTILQTPIGAVPLLAKLDNYNPNQRVIADLKTGAKWTQAMADQSDQLTFYALVYLIRIGKFPILRIHWAQTVHEKGRIRLTGHTATFETTRSLHRIHLIRNRAIEAWRGINRMAKEEWRRYI